MRIRFLCAVFLISGLGLTMTLPTTDTVASEWSCEICSDGACADVGSWDVGWANCWMENPPFCFCWSEGPGSECVPLPCDPYCRTSEPCFFPPGGF